MNHRGATLVARRLYNFKKLIVSQDLLHFFLAEYTFVLVAATTFRRESALRIGGFLPRETLNFAEDYEFHIRLFTLGMTFKFIEDSLTTRRRRSNSLSLDARVCMRPEVFLDGVKCLHLIREWLPPRYHAHLPDIVHRRGTHLFRSGWRHEARRAFRIAREWGGPRYRKKPGIYRWLAKTFGPEFAEWMVFFYSRLKSRKLWSCGKIH
jgi:hypothetical protein